MKHFKIKTGFYDFRLDGEYYMYPNKRSIICDVLKYYHRVKIIKPLSLYIDLGNIEK